MDATERARIVDIVAFWFGDWDERVASAANDAIASRWWKGGKDFDAECARFEPDLVRAATEHYSRWMETANGSAALVLLLDQFPRNIHRGTPGAFAKDHLAQKVTHHAIEFGIDRQMTLPQRVFLYMPFMHSEDRALHRAARPLFEQVVEDARAQGSAHVKMYEQNVAYEDQHAAIIERFGRYPHRNAILGRPSTPEEIEFLKQPGSSF